MIASITIPALTALVFKLVLLGYATRSGASNKTTHLFLALLVVLALHNFVEFLGLNYFVSYGLTSTMAIFGFGYIAFLVPAVALILHISLRLSFDLQASARTSKLQLLVYFPAAILLFLLLFTDRLVVGFQPFQNSLLRVPGPLYYLFETYVGAYLLASLVNLVYGARSARRPIISRTRNRLWLLALLPTGLLLVYLIVANHFGWAKITSTIYIPVTLTFFLIVTTYATHQYRLFDIGFYIPWSKVRRRKTAFYDRIRAMIAEIADLGAGSVSEALGKLADTLRCPVAFVDDAKAVAAAVGAPQMVGMPVDALKHIDHIVVANEIVEARPELYAAMKQHAVAAIVPFHPHSQSAASWLLLGEAFSDQVYTPRDFRMVEQLFEKMADLFLDKLVAMRTQLADAHLQIRTLTFQLEQTQVNTAILQQRVETLGRENLRLVREQPADALLLTRRPATEGLAITLLGWNKNMRERLRTRFPQLEHFVGPDSSSFRRRGMPDVLLCEVGTEARAIERKLVDLIVNNSQRCVVLLFGSGATAFATEHRRQLLGKPVEVLPPELSDEGIERRMQALVRLRQSLFAVPYPEFPLLGCSGAYSEALAEANRIAGFADPICIKSPDLGEAIAVGAYIHETSKSGGTFRVLRTAKLLARENRADGDEYTKRQITALLTEIGGGTLMIDDLGALPNEAWDELLEKTNEFVHVRLIAACPPSSAQLPTALFKPLRPLTLELPTLRERRQDLPLLVHYYTLQYNLQAGTHQYLSQADVDDLVYPDYPTDLQSLKTLVFGRLHTKIKDDKRQPLELPALATGDPEQPPAKTLDEHVAEVEKQLIEQTLKRCNGNKSKTARLLGLRPNTLHYKLERYGLLKEKR